MSATFTTAAPRGKLFVKGMKKIGGRKKGTPNIATKSIRLAIQEVAQGLGGIRRLIEWAQEDPKNEFAFWTSVYPRLLPLQIAGSGPHGEIELDIKLKGDDLAAELQKRCLPLTVFGADKPVLDLEPQPKQIERNGATAGRPCGRRRPRGARIPVAETDGARRPPCREGVMLGSPWDQSELKVLRDEEHCVVGVTVTAPADGDPRFAIGFRTSTGRTLRVRLPNEQLIELAETLLRIAGRRADQNPEVIEISRGDRDEATNR
jgi:hypothetical protein